MLGFKKSMIDLSPFLKVTIKVVKKMWHVIFTSNMMSMLWIVDLFGQ
jgi:hypothetical protein